MYRAGFVTCVVKCYLFPAVMVTDKQLVFELELARVRTTRVFGVSSFLCARVREILFIDTMYIVVPILCVCMRKPF